ncbi:FliH/SctL family protein [uncultured Neptuniibacter sp.]|uniref:FliH/SctL family protein n=1 Tax=uncultured Neptuniibacter sp. TaxID=502143 RepID=UPI0026099439|nr:FliH/SctL family protein [uncultured Neptuniibacter sp.]
MSDSSKPYKRIRADEAIALSGWDLPQMTEPSSVALAQKNAPVTVVEEVIAAEKITVSELEEIRESARIEGLAAGLEEGRLKGIEEGMPQGIKEGEAKGYQEGFAKGEGEVQRLHKILGEMLLEFESPLKDQTDQLEEQLLKLVTSLSEAVIGAELKLRPELIQQSIQAALSQLPEPLGRVTLRASPADIQHLENMPLPSDISLNFEVNEQLSDGDYQLITASTLVKNDVAANFADVVDQFYRNALAVPADPHE